MISPQEKAKELVEKYDETLTYIESKSKAKQCALIAVDEIISIKLLWFQKDTESLDYWQEVKQELLNMK